MSENVNVVRITRYDRNNHQVETETLEVRDAFAFMFAGDNLPHSVMGGLPGDHWQIEIVTIPRAELERLQEKPSKYLPPALPKGFTWVQDLTECVLHVSGDPHETICGYALLPEWQLLEDYRDGWLYGNPASSGPTEVCDDCHTYLVNISFKHGNEEEE